MPTTEACARCADPNASQTNIPSHNAAKCFENCSPFFSSSGWNRTFSSTSTSPSFSALLFDSASGPTQSAANATDFPSNSSSFFAAGFKEYFGSGPPLGLPRCDASTKRPPFSIASFNVGSVSRIRVSSVTTPSFSGTLKSTRINTRLPFNSKSRIVNLFMISCSFLWHNHSWLCSWGLAVQTGRTTDGKHPSTIWQSCGPGVQQCCTPTRAALKLRRHKLNQIPHAAGVCPLIVVPRQHFHAAIPDHL